MKGCPEDHLPAPDAVHGADAPKTPAAAASPKVFFWVFSSLGAPSLNFRLQSLRLRLTKTQEDRIDFCNRAGNISFTNSRETE